MSKGTMQRDPVELPRTPGIFTLKANSARVAYVAYTSDLQKRSHSLAHMLDHPKTHWSIRELPKLPPGEWVFTMILDNVSPRRAAALVAATKEGMRKRKYRVIGGARKPTPYVTYKGTPMTLTEAIKQSKCKARYITVWRRIQRGWTTAQALGEDDPPIRWNHTATALRRNRAAKRAAA